jgi:hypothetical protein
MQDGAVAEPPGSDDNAVGVAHRHLRTLLEVRERAGVIETL